MTNKLVVTGLLALALAACGKGTANDAATSGDKTGAAKGAAEKSGSGFFSRSSTVASGTAIEVTINEELSSRTNTVGNAVSGSVSRDVLDEKGKVAIPAGSPVALKISAISPSKKGDASGEGVIELTVTSLKVDGAEHALEVVVSEVPHTMKGRGMTTDVKTKLAVGTAVGAVVGQAIGKDTRATVIGGAAGAVAGGALGIANAQRDVIVSSGARITFHLPQSLSIAHK